jgi:hypothetical protein
MASDNGEQTNQPRSQHPPQPPASSPWAPSPQRDPPEPSDDEPEEATIARPVPPPSAFDVAGGAPTARYSWFEPPAQREVPAGDEAPPAGSANDERTQSFSRPDLRFDEPAPAPTQPMPPPPGVPYQPQPASPYPPPPPHPQQAYPQSMPYQPEAPAQPAWSQPGWSQPGYGPPPYQPDSGYPPQQPYGAPPPGYGQYGQQPYATYAPPPAPPKRRRVVLWIAAAVVVVIVALAIAAFTAKPGFLGFKKVLDHTAVENTIEQAGYTNVVCNDGKNPTVKKGTTFSCTADGGKKITVRITSSSGNYEWSPVS